jgi:hypothetical protein
MNVAELHSQYGFTLKLAWNNSHAFMVLNDDAVHLDQTGGGKVESASI